MKNKIALISGAYLSGIGEAVRREFLDIGWSVIALYDPADKGKVIQNEKNLTSLPVDLTSSQSIEKALSQLPNKLDAYIHAAMYFGMNAAFDQELWSNTFQVNVISAAQIVESIRTKLVLGGSIVAISSTEAFMGSYGAPAYSSSRAAMHNLVKSWANKYGSEGIRANAVAAGWIGGVMDTDEVFNKSRKITPLGRLGSPKEIATTVKFLCSDESSFINGSVITADGGYSGVDIVSKFEYQDHIAKTDFERFTAEFITKRASAGDEIWAVSKMFTNEWEDTAEIRQYMKDQIAAVSRGAVINRIFVLPDCKYSPEETVYKFHLTNKGINGYVVDYNMLKKNDPELFDMFGDGVAGFNEDLVMFDIAGDDETVRGVLVTEGKQISKLRVGFEKLLKIATKMTQRDNMGRREMQSGAKHKDSSTTSLPDQNKGEGEENIKFQDMLKQKLESADDLLDVENCLISQARRVNQNGNRLGLVVGKITPSIGETLKHNKSVLAQRAKAVAELFNSQNIVVFSSAVVPDSLDSKFPATDFYAVFNRFISNHVQVLITTKGWQSSLGATNEVKIARDKHLEIYHFENGSLQLSGDA